MVEKKIKGKCFCGAVELEVIGDPVSMGYCHCEDCAAWSATPINSYSLWKPNQVKIKKGIEDIGIYFKTSHSRRKFCKKCGGHILNEHPDSDLVDVFALILKNFDFKPSIHVHYDSRTVSVVDGLPKFKDLPTEFNGTGEITSE